MTSYLNILRIAVVCISFLIFSSSYGFAWEINPQKTITNGLKGLMDSVNSDNKDVEKTSQNTSENTPKEAFIHGIDGFVGTIYDYDKNEWGKVYFPWKTHLSDFEKANLNGFQFNRKIEQVEGYEGYRVKGSGNFYGAYTDLNFYNNELFGITTYFSDNPHELIDFDNETFSVTSNLRRDRKLFKNIVNILGDGKVDEASGKITWANGKNDIWLFKIYDLRNHDTRMQGVYNPIRNVVLKIYNDAEEKLESQLRAKSKQESIKVKGLYLGMYYEDAIEIAENIFNKKVSISKAMPNGNSSENFKAINYGATIEYNKSGLVTSIYIKDSNRFFNMQGISTKEFVQNFCKAYNVPRMKRYNNLEVVDIPELGKSSGYFHESPDGYIIKIIDSYTYEGTQLSNLNNLLIAKKSHKKSGTFD